MRKLRLAVVLPGFVVGLALPAWAVDPPSEQKPPAAAAQSEQKSTDSLSKDSPKETDSTKSPAASAKGKDAKSHGPTAVMDRATPAEKSPEKSPVTQGNAKKHPPTAQMDQATPSLKSPGATSSSTQASGSESESPPPK
jgi:hypothetical protein